MKRGQITTHCDACETELSQPTAYPGAFYLTVTATAQPRDPNYAYASVPPPWPADLHFCHERCLLNWAAKQGAK